MIEGGLSREFIAKTIVRWQFEPSPGWLLRYAVQLADPAFDQSLLQHLDQRRLREPVHPWKNEDLLTLKATLEGRISLRQPQSFIPTLASP